MFHQIRQRINKKIVQGFTLVELMFAMTFISIMLVAIAACIIQIGNIYQRGVTLTAINTSGRVVASTLQRDIASSVPFTLDDAHFNETGGVGRLCLGGYTYVWNTPSSNQADRITLAGGEAVTFARVEDLVGSYCQKKDSIYPRVITTGVKELLNDTNSADRGLVLRNFDIKKTGDNVNALYTITYTIGTSDQSAIDAASSTCKPPTDAQSDLNYCGVNTFSVTVRAGNSESVVK